MGRASKDLNVREKVEMAKRGQYLVSADDLKSTGLHAGEDVRTDEARKDLLKFTVDDRASAEDAEEMRKRRERNKREGK